MVAQRQDLSVRHAQGFSFVPTTLKEAQEYATIIANSGICPESFRGRPNDVLIVLQLGSEIGLKPMQALRTLGSINGMPFAYGDGQLSLVKRHPQFENMKEWFEGDLDKKTLTAYCTMMRRGSEPVTQKFSVEDAKLAGLWEKAVWKKYPRRMLQHRARGYAARDAFPDALYGLMHEEEARSIAEEKVYQVPKTTARGVSGLEQALGINDSEAEDAVIISESDIRAEADGHYVTKMADLIIEKQVPEKSIEKWKAQFCVLHLDELPLDAVQAIIKHLENLP
jgi:hypothetical protein